MFNLERMTCKLEANRKFYLRCSIDTAVYEITSPASPDEIVEAMTGRRKKEVRAWSSYIRGRIM